MARHFPTDGDYIAATVAFRREGGVYIDGRWGGGGVGVSGVVVAPMAAVTLVMTRG